MTQDAKPATGSKDFNLPQPTAQAQPANPAQPVQPTATQVVAPPSSNSVGSIDTNGAIIGFAVLLVLAIVFFFIRGAIRSHLISHKASSSSAGSASWALFVFLLSTSATVLFGTIGKLWSVLPFILPLGALCFVTLVLFLALYIPASKGRQ